jgi:hypothetical protein
MAALAEAVPLAAAPLDWRIVVFAILRRLSARDYAGELFHPSTLFR